jgi:hypothetical protein
MEIRHPSDNGYGGDDSHVAMLWKVQQHIEAA